MSDLDLIRRDTTQCHIHGHRRKNIFYGHGLDYRKGNVTAKAYEIEGIALTLLLPAGDPAEQ